MKQADAQLKDLRARGLPKAMLPAGPGRCSLPYMRHSDTRAEARETQSQKTSRLRRLEEECRTTFDRYTNRRSELGLEGGVAPTCSQAIREQDLLCRLEDQLRMLENGDKRSPLLPAPTPGNPPRLLLPAPSSGGLPRALLPVVPDCCSLPHKGPSVARVTLTTLGGIGGLPEWSASLPSYLPMSPRPSPSPSGPPLPPGHPGTLPRTARTACHHTPGLSLPPSSSPSRQTS